MRFAKVFFLAGIVFGSGMDAYAADKNDIYFEGFVGMGVDSNRRLLLGSTVGYCPWDEIGLGLTAEQGFASQGTDSFDSSFRAAVEFRWFLEPWEFWVDTGFLLSQNKLDLASTKSGSINLGTAYLYALTSSMALRAAGHIQFPYTSDGQVFATLALRILW